MPSRPQLPRELLSAPFRGSDAVSAGLITPAMLRGRSWRRLLHGVYAHRALELDHRVWCRATALVLPADSAIGGLSAAYLWGVDQLLPDAPVSIVAPRDGSIHRGVARSSIHYTVIGDGDFTVLDGVPVCTPERTAFDLGRRLPRVRAISLMDAMFRQRPSSAAGIAELARQRHWWPGVRQLTEVLRLADGRAESPMESRVRLLLIDGGLRPPTPQFEVRDEHGRLIGRVDLAWPDARLAVEYEGDHHRDRDQFRRDLYRVNALRMAGWTVLRLTADDVFHRPGETITMIAAELMKRR